MNVWIIRDGDKEGPYPDYDIRRKIEDGELDANTPAWYERLDDWTTLGEIDLFESTFIPPSDASKNPDPLPPIEKQTEPSTNNPHLIRRFWARWLDLYLFGGCWWLLMWAGGSDIEQLLTQPWIMMFHYVPWFALEAFLIHRFATTPGKWLLNLKVLNLDGSRLSLAASSIRAARILFMGIGFGVQGVTLICQALGWITTKSLGRPLWDRAGGHFLDGTPLNPQRIGFYVMTLIFAIWLQSIVLTPYIIKTMEKTFPDQAEILKEDPPWHLPKRH